jgi:hypothetical protein
MKHILPAIIITAMQFFSFNSFAQTQQPGETPAPSPAQPAAQPVVQKTAVTFFAGAIYSSRLHYYGRTDNEKSSALLPTLMLQFDSAHIYVSGTAVLLNNKEQTMDYAGTVAEVGYKFGKLKGLNGNVYVNKFFYNTTQLPQSALKAQVGTNLSHLNKIINVTASASAAFSDKTDFFTSAGLNKNFKWKKDKAVFVVTPTFLLNVGSQNYTQLKDVNTNQNSKRFSILSYEINMPLIYARKHLYFIVTPSYVIPENLITVPGHPELSEMGSNLFFANVTVLYSFKK